MLLQIALVVLIPFAALRLTRLVTADKIAEHLVIRHIRIRSAVKIRGGESVPANGWAYLTELLDCPYCAGFWITSILFIVGLLVALFGSPIAVLVFVLIYGSLGLSYVVGHVSARFDH